MKLQNLAEPSMSTRDERSVPMNWKSLVAIWVVAAFPSLALAEKPTKAEVVKVVQTIMADKAKVKIYCDQAKLVQEALDEEDAEKRQGIDEQMEAMNKKLGPEYVKVMDGMQEIDPDSAEGKDLYSAWDPLDKKCTP
jgi:hypothetical protein